MKRIALLLLTILLLANYYSFAQEVKPQWDNNTIPSKMGLYNERTQRWVSTKRYQNGGSYQNYRGVYYYSFQAENGLWGVVSSQNYNEWHFQPTHTYDEWFAFSETGCMKIQKGQDWGLIDIKGRILLPVRYQNIWGNTQIVSASDWDNRTYDFNLKQLFAEADAREERERQEKARKAAEEKARLEAEAKRAQEIRDAELKQQKLASFTKYASEYVQPRMAEWQQKGEFEKMADYQRRVSGERRQQKIDEMTQEAEQLFIKENSDFINLKTILTLGTYDSENEVFPLQNNKFGMLLLPVPISDGPAFKQNFSKAQITNEKYFVDKDKIALASFDVIVNDKTYHYSNNNALNYSQYQLNPDALDLPAINIVTGSSNATMRKPRVMVISPQTGSQYQQSTVVFRINIIPGDGQHPTLYVEINGADKIEIKPLDQQSKGARATDGHLYELNLPTEPGKSVNLAFSAVDEQNISSETQKVRLIYTGQMMKPRLILFTVGVGDYTSGDITKLRYAAKDARDFVTTIENANLEDYTELIKHVYIDKNATRKNITSGLRSLLDEVRQGDVVMFYFSGHGVQDGSETFFMTVDASSESPDEEAVSFSSLKNSMRKLTERHAKVITFMDACHAGAMANAKGSAPKLTELDIEDVIEFYSSTKGEESAEDEKLENGVFTSALITGINGAAANAEGYITVNTLRIYINDYVRNHNNRQTPVVRGADAGDITLFRKK
jgi:hypothetical protein